MKTNKIIKNITLGIGGLLSLSFIFGASLNNQFASKEESFYAALAYEGTPLPTSGTLSSGTYYISSDFTVSSQLKITSGNVIVNLNGHILNGKGRDHGIFHVTGGTLTVNGKDDATGNRGTLNDGGGYYPGDYSYGGALYIVGGGATFNDLDITNCQANYGGAIYMSNSAVTLNNCNLSHNTDDIAWGGHGAITVGDSSAAGTGLTVNGGEIFSNESGIRLGNKAKATINGAYIHDNDKHGVRVETNEGEGGLTISGNTIIRDNNPSSSRNLLLNNNNVAKVIIASELGDDAYIGVTISGDTKGVFTNSTDTSLNDASKFFSDDSNYGVMKNDDGQLMLTEIVATIKNGSDITNYDSIEPALSNWVNGSTLTLLRDVVTSSTITVNNTRTLDLNGCGIKAANTGFSIFNVGSSGDLTVNDSDPKHPHKVTLEAYLATGVSNGAGEDDVDDGNGTAYINGGYVAGGFKGLNGGAFYVSGGTLTLNGGTLIGNKSDGNGCSGGAIYLESNGYFKMNGGSIKYNYSGNAGAGIAAHQSTIETNGGVISFNRNNWSGGGAMSLNNGSTLKLYGGVIENNVSRHPEGAISFKSANESLGIKGSPIVRNNTTIETGYAANLRLYNGKVAHIDGPLTKEADIHICYVEDVHRAITDGWSTHMAGKDPNDYFFNDNPNNFIYLKDGEAYCGVDVAKVQNGETTTYYDNFTDALAAWTDGTTLTLLKDVTMSSAITISNTRILDLNGYGINASGISSNPDYAILVNNGGELILNDSGDTTHYFTHERYKGYDAGLATICDKATYDAADENLRGTFQGGYLTGLVIERNEVIQGGFFKIEEGGSITMNGGTIIGIYADYSSSCVCSNGTFIMNDGNMIYNVNARGCINARSGILTINGGNISHNTDKSSKNSGRTGALWLNNIDNPTYTIRGGTITNNVAINGAINTQSDIAIEGNPVIKDNIGVGTDENSDAPMNIVLSVGIESKLNFVGEYTGSEPLGVSINMDNVFDVTNSADVSFNNRNNVVSDNPNYAIGVYPSGHAKAGQLFIGNEVTVTYNNNGHGAAPDNETVASGSLITEPTALTEEGWMFGGWYKDEECTDKWNYGTDTITADRTLYAGWKVPYEIIPPTAITGLDYTANNQNLINAGSADYGELLYAVNTTGELPNESEFTSSIPTGNLVGTYYVFYMTTGDADHYPYLPSLDNKVEVTIARVDRTKVEALNEEVKEFLETIKEDSKYNPVYTALEATRSEIEDEAITEDNVTSEVVEENYLKLKEAFEKHIQNANVIKIIDDIGDLTYDGGVNDSLNDILKARTAYDKLSQEQKQIVDDANKDVLDNDMIIYKHVDKVGDLIKGIPTPNASDEYYDAVDFAKAEYDKLTEQEKEILNTDYNFDYIKAIADNQKAIEVIKVIDEIGDVTYNPGNDDSLDDIKNAEKIYNSLTEDQKKLVDLANHDELQQSRDTYDKVDDTVKKIDSIGDITHGGEDDSKEDINKAREIYDSLTPEQKALVNGYKDSYVTLDDAEHVYDVLEKIDAIGEVGFDTASEEAIEEAKKYYSSLTEEQKAKVKENKKIILVQAEQAYDEKKQTANILLIILIIIASLLLLSGIIVLIILIKKRNKEDDENNDNNKKTPVKVASFAGLTPMIFMSHYLDVPFILLYIISGLALLAWIAVIIVAIFYKRHKKQQALEEAPQQSKQVEAAQSSDDEEETVTITDEKGNIFNIRYIKSFTAKLIQSNDETKAYYEELKNYVLSYKKTNSRVSWHYDSVHSGRNQVLKFAIRGKTLCIYLPLNPNDYADSKYKVETVDSKKYEEVPCLYRIKNDRRRDYAKDLIDVVMTNLGLVKGEEQHNSYYLHYEENKPLIIRGLIKELKVQVNKPVIRETQILSVVTNEEGEEVITKQDSKGNIFQIRYIKSFTAKLIQANDESKHYYEELKNYVLSYKKTTSRISWNYDSINSGRNPVLKFVIRGKTLCVYFPLNPDDYTDTKYKVEKVESKKFEEVPCLYRIKNDRRLNYAKELIDLVASNLGLVKQEEKHESYYLHYEENKPLIARGLIKELEVQVNKPVVRETQVLKVVTNEDGDEVVTKQDSKGNIFQIRYIKSFTAKLSQSDDEVKDYYNELKNYALSYKKANSRISWHYDSINVGRNQVLKFSIRGKTLCLYYALDANNYADSKYKVEAVESKKYEDVPCLYRIKNDRRRDYAKELIDVVMNNVPTELGKQSDEDFRIPYEETNALLAKGLIKELKVKIDNPEPVNKTISVHEVDEKMSDEIAESKIEEDTTSKKHVGKKGIINIDTIGDNFNDNDVVDIETLWKKKLVSSNVGYVKVLARGSLNKRLTINLQDYSLQAVKMVLLAGGKVKKAK